MIREAEIPEGAFESLIQRQDETLARLRQAGQRAFRKIHETLDARQRDLLANLVESWGPGFSGRVPAAERRRRWDDTS